MIRDFGLDRSDEDHTTGVFVVLLISAGVRVPHFSRAFCARGGAFAFPILNLRPQKMPACSARHSRTGMRRSSLVPCLGV